MENISMPCLNPPSKVTANVTEWSKSSVFWMIGRKAYWKRELAGLRIVSIRWLQRPGRIDKSSPPC